MNRDTFFRNRVNMLKIILYVRLYKYYIVLTGTNNEVLNMNQLILRGHLQAALDLIDSPVPTPIPQTTSQKDFK